MLGNWIRPLFVISGLYDGVVGLAFLFFAPGIFERFGVTPPNHFGYVHFPALLLILFAVMFFTIAANPVKNRDLIWYGIGLKVAYSGSVFWYQLTDSVPAIWLPWAWADLVFIVLFVAAWSALRRPQPEHA